MAISFKLPLGENWNTKSNSNEFFPYVPSLGLLYLCKSLIMLFLSIRQSVTLFLPLLPLSLSLSHVVIRFLSLFLILLYLPLPHCFPKITIKKWELNQQHSQTYFNWNQNSLQSKAKNSFFQEKKKGIEKTKKLNHNLND